MRLLRVSTAAAAAAGLALLAGACSGPVSGEGVASATGKAGAKDAAAQKKKVDPQQAGLDFARCMREHGVDMADPEPGQPGGAFSVRVGEGPSGGSAGPAAGQATAVDSEAFEACHHILDDAIGEPPGPSDPQMADRALKFAQCMRDHGVNMPDPVVSGGMVRVEIGEGLDPSSPTLQEAQQACSQLFGPPGGAVTAGPGGSGGFGVAVPAGGRS